MATKKTTNKSETTKKSATTKKTTAPTAQQETGVTCPVCGTELDVLAQHEHTEKNVTMLGMDSGMGTIVLPVSKRGDALKAAGVDTSRYFSIHIPGGGEQMMKKTDDGGAVPVSADDPIVKMIMGKGTVPNRKLFRRWVMSQVFHGLTAKDYYGKEIGFTEWLRRHGYQYQWEMLIDELHVQTRLLTNRDLENFIARNRWFNRDLAVAMAEDYIDQVRKDVNSRPQHKCKGVPYVRVDSNKFPKGIFVADIEKKLIWPLRQLANNIECARNPQDLEDAVRNFWKQAPVMQYGYKQCAEWKDAYKGMGAYATMQNLLRFHGCTFPKGNDFYAQRGMDALEKLEMAAKVYAKGEGWRLFGLMKQMLDENEIDIEEKMAEWAAAKAIHNS